MLAARGLPYKEVARDLGLSEGTVKLQMHKVMRKLGVKTRSKAMTMILREAAARKKEPDVS
jgi:DNA-binding NarL/FixJ family response regulator